MAAAEQPAYADAGHPGRYRVLAAVMLGSVLGPIDGSIVNVILPTIGAAFSAPLATVQWVPMVYLLTIGSLVLLFGRAADIWGYRRVYLLGLAGFVATSALCAAAPGIHALIAFRALQGLTAAMMMAVPLAIITGVFPAAQRGKALGLYAISISVGLAIGPSLGGFLAAAYSWRAAFLINVPVGMVGFALAWRLIPDMRGRGGRMDLRGGVTALGGLTSFLLFVNRVQQRGLTAVDAPLLAAAIAFGAAFIRTERTVAEPMLDLRLFADARLSFGALAAVFNFMSQFVVVFLTPFFLQRILGEGPAHVGLVMTAFPIAVLAAAPFAGALSDRIGTALPAVAGTSVAAVACAWLAALPAGSHEGHVAMCLALFGLGTGIFQAPNSSAVMGSAPPEHRGVISSLLSTTRTVGMVLGVAAGGAVLYAAVPAAVLNAASFAPAGAGAFVAGLRHAYAAGALFAALAALSSLIRGASRTPSRRNS